MTARLVPARDLAPGDTIDGIAQWAERTVVHVTDHGNTVTLQLGRDEHDVGNMTFLELPAGQGVPVEREAVAA